LASDHLRIRPSRPSSGWEGLKSSSEVRLRSHSRDRVGLPSLYGNALGLRVAAARPARALSETAAGSSPAFSNGTQFRSFHET